MSGLVGTSHTRSNVIGSSDDTAKAWILFNGSGTIAIRKSYNVSSITDHSTGQWSVTFSTAMADSNIVAFGFAERSDQQGENFTTQSGSSTTALCLFYNRKDDGSYVDSSYLHVIFFN